MTEEIKRYMPFAIFGMFISMPLMTLFAIIHYFKSGAISKDHRPRYFLYLMLALVPAIINTTKPVDYSDLGYYYWLYNFAGSKSFIDFIALIPKEPLYHIYTYISYYLTFGSFKFFVILTSLLMYMPVMMGFDILIRKNGISTRVALYASILLVLFPQYFFYTMQIIRQVLAGSIAFYCIVKSLYYPKCRWALFGVFCAGLIHASAFLFSFFYIARFTIGWNLKLRILLLICCGLFLYSILGFIASTVSETSTLAYAANRGLAENNEIINVGMFPRLVSLSIVPMGLYLMVKNRSKLFSTFIIISFVIAGFVVLKWDTPLMVLRFMEYTYMYIPIMVALTMYYLKLGRYLSILAWGMVMVFCYLVPQSNFQYEPLYSIFIKGVLFYLI